MPVHSRLFPTFSFISLSVTKFILRSLIAYVSLLVNTHQMAHCHISSILTVAFVSAMSHLHNQNSLLVAGSNDYSEDVLVKNVGLMSE